MKKLITLCTLLLCAVVTSWADAYDVTTDKVIILNDVYDAKATDKGYSTHSAIAWGGTASTNSRKAGDPANNGEATSSNVNCYSVKGNGGGKDITVSVKNCSKIIVYHEKQSSRYVELRNGSKTGDVLGKSAGNTYYTEVALDVAKSYTIFLHGIKDSGDDQDFYVYAVKLFAPAAPIITTQPVGADYAVGDPIAPLSVGATASSGTLSYQWYSCSDAEKTGASEIAGATGASYTPTAAGFYYVVVTDDKGFVESNVVEITISAASAPTINVTGAPVGDIVKDTEVTLTAVVEGVPTPTIQWYSNTTATTSGGVALDGETSETYSPSTAATGTYYYYAVATNKVTSTASAVQTIVVKEKVATPTFTPNGAYFETSQDVELGCATDGAIVLYSTDGGDNWNTYSTKLNFAETTTVQVKATKDGYFDSEVTSATFTKIILDSQDPISATTTWDWTKFGTKEINTNGTAFYRKEVLVGNVDQYGFTSPAAEFGPANALILKGDYIVRDTKFCQVTHAKFVTTVPGTVSVEFSNTGSDDRPYRYLYVNDVQTEFKSNTSKSNVTATDIPVGAGEVDLYGVLDPEADDPQAGFDNFIRIYKITFTPVVSGTITKSGFSTYSTNYPVDLSTISGGTAYIATGAADGKVTLEKCEAKVPAATGLLIAGNADDTFTIYTTAGATEAPAANLLVGLPAGGEAPVGSYVFAWPTADPSAASFYIVETTPAALGAGKAYLDVPAGDARLSLSFGEDAGEATGISEMKSQKADGAIFNLRGQRVAQPQKGLYILNGKKTIVK